jgi:surface protein
MRGMFLSATSFNQPLDNLDVSSVTDMWGMFYNASSFNQPIGDWNVSSVTNMDNMFNGVTLHHQNYDDLLIGWASLTLQLNVNFHGGNGKYSSNATTARQYIIDTFNWSIYDAGLI